MRLVPPLIKEMIHFIFVYAPHTRSQLRRRFVDYSKSVEREPVDSYQEILSVSVRGSKELRRIQRAI
jgi:hypothetical protein